MDMSCPQGSRNSLRDFEGKVKGRVCPEYLVWRLHTEWLISRLCGKTERDQRGLLLWFPVFPSMDPAIIPFLCATKLQGEGTVGLCVSAPAKEDLSQMEQFSPQANSDFHKACPVVWGWKEMLSSALLGCCSQSTDSIHINGALLAQ